MYSRGINRNIVECKDLSNVIVSIKSLVLIETSWNVKAAPTIISPANGERVLIETSWNVKKCILIKTKLWTSY